MLSRAALLAVLVVFAASGSAEAVHYGGGYVPSPEGRVFDPPVNLTFQDDVGFSANGGRFRFSTLMRCGNDTLDVQVDGDGVFTDRTFYVRKRSARLPYRGNATVRYEMHATISGAIATGAFHLTGKWVRGGRTTTCDAGPVRALKLHAEGDARGANAAPAPGSAFYGIGGFADPWRSPVLLAVNHTGRRAMAFWDYTADCPRGPSERLTNYTPLTTIKANRLLSRERFRISYLNKVVGYYRATLDVRFHGATATGTYRMRVRFTHRGRTTLRCDSKTRRVDLWTI